MTQPTLYALQKLNRLFSICSRFVQVIVSGINPVDLIISSPELVITNCSSVKLMSMHSSAEYVSFVYTSLDLSLWNSAVNIFQCFDLFSALMFLDNHK